MNKSQTFCGKCLFTAVSWQGLVRLINSNGGWAKPTISSWPANGHSMFGNHRDISASRHCWGLLYWSNQFSILWKVKILPFRAVRVQAYHLCWTIPKVWVSAFRLNLRRKLAVLGSSPLIHRGMFHILLFCDLRCVFECVLRWIQKGFHWYGGECFIGGKGAASHRRRGSWR